MNSKFYDIGFNEVGGKVFFNEGVFSQYFHIYQLWENVDIVIKKYQFSTLF